MTATKPVASDRPTTMKAAVLVAPHTFEVREVPVPSVREGWALVRTELTGLCGTDLSIVQGAHPRAAFPLTLGHEITGQVVDARGPLAAGTRVIAEPLIQCGRCRPCREGASHVCRELGLFGIDRAGSLAEYVVLPIDSLVPVAPSAPLAQAAFAEPLAVAVHALSAVRLEGKKSVLVFGGGPIGILTAMVARLDGAAQVTIVEPSTQRRAIAQELGFGTLPVTEHIVDDVLSLTEGSGADIVFDTAGTPSVAAVLAPCTRTHGTVVMVAVHKQPAAVDLQRITFAELSLVGVRVYTRSDVERAVALIEQRHLPLDQLPVETFALEDAAEAVRTAAAGPRALKVFVGPARAGV